MSVVHPLEGTLKKLFTQPEESFILLELYLLFNTVRTWSTERKKEVNSLNKAWFHRNRGKIEDENDFWINEGVSITKDLKSDLNDIYLIKEGSEYSPLWFYGNNLEQPAISARSLAKILMRKQQDGKLRSPPIKLPDERRIAKIFKDLERFDQNRILEPQIQQLPLHVHVTRVPDIHIPYSLSGEALNAFKAIFSSGIPYESFYMLWDLMKLPSTLQELYKSIQRRLKDINQEFGTPSVLKHIKSTHFNKLPSRDGQLIVDDTEKIQKLNEIVEQLIKSVEQMRERLGTQWYGQTGYPRTTKNVEAEIDLVRGKPQFLPLIRLLWDAWLYQILLLELKEIIEVLLSRLKYQMSPNPSPIVLNELISTNKQAEEALANILKTYNNYISRIKFFLNENLEKEISHWKNIFSKE